MIRLAVYGSLKKGAYNHNTYLKDARFVSTGRVFGSMWLHRHGYPYLLRPASTPLARLANDHYVEVYDLSEEDYQAIHAMEIDSGYHPEEVELIEGETAIVFFGDPGTWLGKTWITEYSQWTAPDAFT